MVSVFQRKSMSNEEKKKRPPGLFVGDLLGIYIYVLPSYIGIIS